jgi:hypothetical protein
MQVETTERGQLMGIAGLYVPLFSFFVIFPFFARAGVVIPLDCTCYSALLIARSLPELVLLFLLIVCVTQRC